MNIDPNIRFVTIFDINGKIKYSDHREGVENLLNPESKKSLKLALNGWKVVVNWLLRLEKEMRSGRIRKY